FILCALFELSISAKRLTLRYLICFVIFCVKIMPKALKCDARKVILDILAFMQEE
ncbi:unnamed protein product, partial [Plutella xylostella]